MSRMVILALLLACSQSKTNSDSKKDDQAATAAVEPATIPAKPSSEPKQSLPEPGQEPGQSFQDGMQLICDSLEHIDANLPPSERQKAVATWIGENVTNPQVRELFSIMGDIPPSKRAGMMKAAAAKAGITKCPIAEQ